MNTKLKGAISFTLVVIAVMGFIIPSLANRYFGRSAMLRFDPKHSSDYNCIFVEGHSRPSFAIPWLTGKTPIQYLRIRYTPNAEHQPYGIMFIDPTTMAYEAHAGFAKIPEHFSGRLDSPIKIRDWMLSQANSDRANSHEGDATEIYEAIIALVPTNIDHFVLPADMVLSHFQIGFRTRSTRTPSGWLIALMVLIPFWFSAFRRPRGK